MYYGLSKYHLVPFHPFVSFALTFSPFAWVQLELAFADQKKLEEQQRQEEERKRQQEQMEEKKRHEQQRILEVKLYIDAVRLNCVLLGCFVYLSL